MNGVSKILKTVFWATFLFAPLFYFGMKAMPMIQDTMDYARNAHARTQANRQDKLDALDEAASLGSAAEAASAEELQPTDDPNLAMNEDAVASESGGSSGGSSGSRDGLSAGATSQNLPRGGKVASGSSKTKSKKPVIEITNANLSEFWDPAAEERINGMAISEELKRQILDNYHRTGVLPDAVATNRAPAAER